MRSNNFEVNVTVTMCIEVEEIFGRYDFLALVIFWSIFLDLMDRKMPGSKKVVITKNQFFHARQPRKRIFEIRS